MAQAAFKCGAHARALLFFEQHVRSLSPTHQGLNTACSPIHQTQIADQDVRFLQQIYSQLEEPDGLGGLLRLRSEAPPLEDQVLALERAGKFAEALSLYELGVQQESRVAEGRPEDGGDHGLTPNERGRLHCLLRMGHLQQVITQVDGLVEGISGPAKQDLASNAVAAAWRLGQWSTIDKYLDLATEPTQGDLRDPSVALTPDNNWEVRMGFLLRSAERQEWKTFHDALDKARREILGPLSAASMESYTRAYPHMVQLHILEEMESFARSIQNPSTHPLAKLQLEERLQVLQTSLPTHEPLLAMRAQMSLLAGDEEEAGKAWLRLAKTCRRSGHIEAATTFCLESLSRGVLGAGLEYAKLLWTTDNPYRAITSLRDSLKQLEKDIEVRSSKARTSGRGTGQVADTRLHSLREAHTKMLLQLARWSAESHQGSRSDVMSLFSQVVQAEGQWEKAYFFLAQYLDNLMVDAKKRNPEPPGQGNVRSAQRTGGRVRIELARDAHYTELLPQVVDNYVEALARGHRHILQAMPRMLTIWYVT